MPLINVGGSEEDIEQLKSDVSALQTAVNNQSNSITTLNNQLAIANSNISTNQNNITTLNTQMAVANSNITNNQSSITNLTTRVTNCENNISNLTTQQTATTANVNLLQSSVQNFAIDLLQNTGQINTINNNYTLLERRVKTLEDNPGGGGSSVPEYLIKSTIAPISDVYFNGTQGANQKLLLRFFNPLPIDSHNKLQGVAVKAFGDSDVKIYTATEAFVGYEQGSKAYRKNKNNAIITNNKLFNENALFYAEKYTEQNDNGVWGFGLNLPGNVVDYSVHEQNGNTLICFYDETDINIYGTYTVRVDVGLQSISIEKDNVFIGSITTDYFLYQIGGNALFMAFPEYEQNCSFSFEIQNPQPPQPVNDVVMIHGILLENALENYGQWTFDFDIQNMEMHVVTPDSNAYNFNIADRDPEHWFNCGNFKFAFMMRYDPQQQGLDSFSFNFNGIGTQYYDGTQAVSRMGGSGDLYAYYRQETGNIAGSSAYFSSQNMTLEFQGNTEAVTEFTEIRNSIPETMFWTEKIDKNTDTTFIF